MKHEPMCQDIKTDLYFDPPSSRILRRIPCSCGWRGCWYATDEMVQRSFERHVSQQAPHVAGCACSACFVYEAL